MLITFVTESHQFQDDKQTVDVLTHEEFGRGIVRDHECRLGGHDAKIEDHGKNIGWLWDKVNNLAERIRELDGKVDGVEKNLDKMPQVLRDSLEQALNGLLEDKLETGARLIAELREERKQVAAQLNELYKERDETSALLQDLKGRCDSAKMQLESVENQVAEFKRSVPVPKKFAKFLFVRQSLHSGKAEDK